jgi:hypothetical protein
MGAYVSWVPLGDIYEFRYTHIPTVNAPGRQRDDNGNLSGISDKNEAAFLLGKMVRVWWPFSTYTQL